VSAVYGIKRAAQEAELDKADQYTWTSGTDYVNGFQLKALAQQSSKGLDDAFGEGFREAFTKDPVGMFASLPDPQKLVLSRMASDNSGTALKT
jgi:hypothetical protein